MKQGFAPRKDAKQTLVKYTDYYLVPGFWVYSHGKATACWAVFNPDKEYLGCYKRYLDAREKVKTDKIAKIIYGDKVITTKPKTRIKK
jgi:hypothetical protein